MSLFKNSNNNFHINKRLTSIMKSKFLVIFELLIFTFVFVINTHATIINVPSVQPTVQAGINVASNSDTVLVEPGIYFENINFNGKNVILGSYYILADDTSYISRTIIDGNKNGSVVVIDNEEDSTTVLCGFTIRHGNGIEKQPGKITGGGIYVNSADPTIKNLIISGNSAYAGAGIYLANSKSFLSDITIKNNDGDGIYSEDSDLNIYNLIISNNEGSGFNCYRTNALLTKGIISKNGDENPWGGGICCSHSSNVKISQLTIRENCSSSSGGGLWSYESNIEFDNENHCNVYLNHAPEGRDISSYNSPTIHVIVDTFTVLNPTEYYATPMNKFTFDIKFAKVTPIEADLFVSPDGDDANSGLSLDQPLKTIGFALQLIRADELHPHTIYLAEGVYSPITNGEIFPIALKSYVSLIGTVEAITILDANNRDNVVYCSDIKGLEIKNLTLRNGNRNNGAGGGIAIIQSNPHLENITIANNSAGDGGGVLIHYYSDPTLTNVTIRDNISLLEGQSGHSVGGGGILIRGYSDPILTNVLIEGNIAQRGAGIRCDETSNPQITHTVVRNNTAKYFGGGLYVHRGSSYLEDVMIEGNHSDSQAAGIYCWESNLLLSDVIIRKNVALKDCGGLYSTDSNIELQNVTINENIAGNSHYDYGGGIYAENSTLNFNTNDRCHIYLNKAGFGNDIYSDTQMSVVVDTFTVVKPTKYHVFPFEHFSFDIQNGKLQQVEGDLYVSPTGDNGNSGATIDAPLRTIDHALSMMYADSLCPGIIYLAEGVYSQSSNQERMPIYGIDYISLFGTEKNATAIDAEDSSDVLWFDNSSGCHVENISITRGDFYNLYVKNSEVEISNSDITNCQKYGIYGQDSDVTLTNVCIVNNHDEGVTLYNSKGTITKSIIQRNNMGIISNGTDLIITQTEISENIHAGICCRFNSVFAFDDVIIKENMTNGIYSTDSEGQLTDVIIKHNLDGGLHCENSTINLANVTISGNETANKGGGIYLTDSSIVRFDPQHLCNIYLNKAGIGKDLFSEHCPLTEVYLDTFTVAHASNYFAAPINSFSFNIQFGKIAQVQKNLFVSPNGDDGNEGTSPEHPLKTIDMALTKITADSLRPRIINLAEGIYSITSNNEFFPLNCRSYVNIIGANYEKTILDAAGNCRVVNCFNTNNSGIQSVTIQNGYSLNGAGVNITCSNPIFSNVCIINNTGVGIFFDHADPTFFRTIIAANYAEHLGWERDRSGGIHCYHSNPKLVNVTINQNGYTYFSEGSFETSFYFSNSSPMIINSIIWNNAINDLYFISDADTHSITIAHSDIQGGDSSIVARGNMQINWLDGNINSDPLFKDAENNDYSLLEDSPCINAGTACVIWQGDTLLHIPDSCYIGNEPDMGAVESEFLNIVDLTRKLPKEYSLHGNYPNPFNSLTIISFQIPEKTTVNVSIYNVLGQKIKILINEKMYPGNYSVTWDAAQFSSGVYIYKLTADNYSCCGKCLLLK